MKLEKQITNEELLELTKKAFDNNEVAEFLCGEKGYACPISHFVPANVPTDFNRIIDFGVYKLYEETKNEKENCDIITGSCNDRDNGSRMWIKGRYQDI